MSNIIDRLAAAALDWAELDDQENAALANDSEMIIVALVSKLRRAESLLASHAAKVGSLYAWWDDIFDIRALLKEVEDA